MFSGLLVLLLEVVVVFVVDEDDDDDVARSFVHMSATHFSQGMADCRSASLSCAKSKVSSSIRCRIWRISAASGNALSFSEVEH